jgi:transposase
MNTAFAQHTHYVGLDWAKDHHEVVLLDRAGTIVANFVFHHDAAGWTEFRKQVQRYPSVGVTVETSQGATVAELVTSGVTVYPVHPQAAKAYRKRQAPSGTKTDFVDAWSLADALRLDGHQWRALSAQDPLVAELRLLCRDEVELITQRTALINQLQAALHEYYPAALEAFEDWTAPYAWEFVVAYPTPEELVKAGQRKWEKYLHSHKLWRPQTAEQRLEIFARADKFCGTAAVTRAKSRLAVSTAKVLQSLQKQLEEYRKAIEQLFAQHPDHDLFGSLPGAGDKLAPRLLSEVGNDRQEYPNPQALQGVAGRAPVSFESGQTRRTKIRWHCNRHLRHAVHLWSDCSRKSCAWAQAYYQAQREKGKSHACALRCLGQRWLKILWKMWQSRQPYDEAIHALNQQKHGSWVLKLQPKTT